MPLLETPVPLWIVLLSQSLLATVVVVSVRLVKKQVHDANQQRDEARQVLLQMLGHKWISPDGKVETRLSWTRDETFYLDGDVGRMH